MKLTGVSYRQLTYWLSSGLIKCSGREASGKGSPRLYSFRDIVVVRVMKGLVNHGMKPASLKKCMNHLHRKFSGFTVESISEMKLITDGKHIFRYVNENTLESLQEDGQFSFEFGLGKETERLFKIVSEDYKPVRYSVYKS